MKRIICSVVGLGVLAMTVAASAQTLADIAKQDTDRRKSVKHPAKVYTNDDVQDVKPILPMMENDGTGAKPMEKKDDASAASPDTSGAAAAGAASATHADPNAKADGNGTAKPAGTPGVKSGDEAAWRARFNAAREAVSRTQLQLESMRSRAAQLTAASAAASEDQRASFQKKQQDALQEYDKLRADLQRSQKALSDLETEASRAGVPPGWLR
jgi:DNA repair exonuclease SbcCD ATPase subunit